MKKRIYVERTKESRIKFSRILSIGLILITLCVSGFSHILQGFESLTTCNGKYSCLIRDTGNLFMVTFSILITYLILYLLFYSVSKWKEVDPKEYKPKKNKKK